MKKKIILIISILFITLSLTGCTKYLKNDKKVPIVNPVTGQNLVSNIICQPEYQQTRDLYIINEIDLTKVPKCSEVKIISGEYEGVWTTIFVKPLAFVLIKIGEITRNYGISIIIVTILIRLAMSPITKKSAVQSENMAKAKPEITKLESKYKGKTDQQNTMQKSQELMVLYKKYNISPLSGCLFAFLQLPLFLAFFEAINRVPVLFEENFMWLQLGTTPLKAISAWQTHYILLVALAVVATYLSFKQNTAVAMDPEQAKQMKFMSTTMVILISFMSFSVASGIVLYWVVNNGFTIVQNLIVKRGKKNANIL